MDGRDIILTIRGYEVSTGMPEDRRLTYVGDDGQPHLAGGDGWAPDLEGLATRYASRLEWLGELGQALGGGLRGQSAVMVGMTPEVLTQAGLRGLPMLVTQRHLVNMSLPKDYDRHQHGIPAETLQRLPDLLARPALVADSPVRRDALALALPAVDSDGVPLVAMVMPDGNGVHLGQSMEANFLLTVFGRPGLFGIVRDDIGSKGVVYYDAEAAEDLRELSGVDLGRTGAVEARKSGRVLRRPSCLGRAHPTGADVRGSARRAHRWGCEETIAALVTQGCRRRGEGR